MDKAPSFKTGPPKDLVFKPVERKPLTDKGRIERHRFYSRVAWAKCRAAKLRRDPLCQRCRKDDRLVEARHVHHVIDLADAPALAYDLDNLESLCHPCHSRETLKRLKESRRGDARPKA